MIYSGIDVGSRTIKVALFDASSGVTIAHGIRNQGVDQQNLTDALYDHTIRQAGLARDDIARLVATGYGRNSVRFAADTVTEITCHAAGVHFLHPDARTIVDIGGEDSKVIRLNDRGKVHDFVMNDRCAAGTGRFLEIVARHLEGDLNSVSQAASGCREPSAISSMCVVFAETEIVGLLASGTPSQNIMAGVQAAIVSRIAGMMGRQAAPPYYFTGGVALVPGMARALSEAIGQSVSVSRDAQFTGALGAAIVASRQKH